MNPSMIFGYYVIISKGDISEKDFEGFYDVTTDETFSQFFSKL